MSGSHAGLLPHQSGHHFEFFAIYIAVSIQIEHSEGNLKVATGNFKSYMVIKLHSKELFFHILDSTVSRKM